MYTFFNLGLLSQAFIIYNINNYFSCLSNFEKLGKFLIFLLNNQNRKILKINKEVIIIIVLILYFILNTPANRAPSGLNAIDKPIIVDIATSNLSLLMMH